VRLATIAALLACAPCASQVIVSPARLRPGLAIFERQPGEAELRCDVTPIRPTLNYSFRFQAGYRLETPAAQFTGKGHAWAIVIRITARAGDRKPVYLVAGQRLPEVPNSRLSLHSGGGYLLGEGQYDVAWVMQDERGRVCRKTWPVDVHLSHSERSVKVAMPRDTVWDFSLRGARLLPSTDEDMAAVRLTVLLNAAPLQPRRTHLRTGDIGTLLSAVTSLLERTRVRQVRLVAFNLEQQKELYRNPDFMLRNMPDVAQAMNAIDLNTVDFEVLKNRHGTVDLLTTLLNQELHESPPSDLVLCIGPMSRYIDRVPSGVFERSPEGGPRFLNFELLPGSFAVSTLPDVIRNAMSRLGGKTVLIRTPGDFAKAIEKLK
jgi:hypothetical protein